MSFDLGFAPIGDKFYEGDGRTPEGTYFIDRRNPNSKFHLSIGISYPNARDRAEAAALGKPPGGDIFHPRGIRSPSSWVETIGLGDALLCRTAKSKRSIRWSKTAHRLRSILKSRPYAFVLLLGSSDNFGDFFTGRCCFL